MKNAAPRKKGAAFFCLCYDTIYSHTARIGRPSSLLQVRRL